MEQATDTGKDKVKKICEVLRKETIEPAIDEARGILEEAHSKGEAIIRDAKKLTGGRARRTLRALILATHAESHFMSKTCA